MTIIPKLWCRLNYLVPEPKCTTFGDDYDLVVWTDARAKPTAAATAAVTDAQLLDAETSAQADAMKSNKDIFKAFGQVTFDFIKNPNLYATKNAYLTACRDRYKEILNGN